jgi:hypothetical protein
MLVLAALSMVVVLGFAALAIDVGNWLHTRTELQKDVDSLALGGAQGLPDQTTATNYADALQSPNGILPGDTVTYSFTEDCDGNAIPSGSAMITVRATRHNTSFLAQLVGISGADITACATAGKYAVGGTTGVRPFALEDTCIQDIGYGGIVTIKWDASDKGPCSTSQGNFGAVDVTCDSPGTCVSGSSEYKDDIINGSTSYLCTDSTSGCCPPNTEPNCLGVSQIETEPGNMVGPTRTGLTQMEANTPSYCDEWSEVQTGGALNPKCAPWGPDYPSGAGTHLIIIPIVHGLWDQGGRHTVTIKSFAVVFLESNLSADCVEPATSTPVPTSTPTSAPSSTPTKTNTPGPTFTPTITSTPLPPTATFTATKTPTITPTPTRTANGSSGNCNGNGNNCTSTPTQTRTPTPVPPTATSGAATNTPTRTPTSTPNGPTSTPTTSPATATSTVTPTYTPVGGGWGANCNIKAYFLKSLVELPDFDRGSGNGNGLGVVALVK